MPREKRGAAESRLDLKHFNAKDVFDKSRRRFQPGLEMRVALALKKHNKKAPESQNSKLGTSPLAPFLLATLSPCLHHPNTGPWVEAPASSRQKPRTGQKLLVSTPGLPAFTLGLTTAPWQRN